MRKRIKNATMSVNAIAGTEVVLIGMDIAEKAREGLLGFCIDRFDQKSKQTINLSNSKKSPIQRFLWSDYTADPGRTYTYTVAPMYRSGKKLAAGKALKLKIKTENPDDGTHAIYFNRGVAGSQGFSRRFGDHRRWYLTQHSNEGTPGVRPQKARAKEFIKPADVPADAAYKWLSRGLEEAMLAFLAKAKDKNYAIRASVYEFTYVPVITGFVEALERGADVQIIHHAKRENKYTLKQDYDADTVTNFTKKVKNKKGKEVPDTSKNSIEFKNRIAIKYQQKDDVARAADRAVSEVGLIKPNNWKAANALLKRFDKMMIERTLTTISHNKFVVLLHKGKPIEVWTGSTNFTDGGIFGQSNVGHLVRDKAIAGKYFEYWKKLQTDPKKKSAKNDPKTLGMQNWTVSKQPDLKGPPRKPITPIFSPRLRNKGGSMLDWYAQRMDGAEHSVFFTAAFSVADQFMTVLKDVKSKNGKPINIDPYQRYLLLEGIGGLLKPKYPILADCPQNRIAWGDTLRKRKNDDEELIETLTGLNSHVNYLHTKYMLIDPLSDDPIVISGSANFSTASTENNDENMLIIRGNTRVADIYLGEFMRLFNHFKSRNERNAMSDKEYAKASVPSTSDAWTKPYFDADTQKYQERKLFS